MDNARQAAAAGFIRSEPIPLLALTDESFYHGKLSWTLRFPVPPPDISGSARRFSSTVTFQQGPHSAEALDGALRLATPFSYTSDASHVLFNSPFLRLPDLSVLRPPRIDSYETPSPPEPAVQDWLNNRAPRLIPSRHRAYTPVPLGLVDYFNSNIYLPQVGMLIATHQCHNEEATAEARKHKRDFSPTAFLRIIPADTVMSGNRLPDLPSTSPTPETLPRTALAPSPSIIPPRPSQPSTVSARPPHSSQSASTRPQHPPPTGPCSDPKRPRIPSKGSAPSGSHSGYMSQFPDNARPVGSSASSADRSGRGPYHKGKGADKGTFKGKDKFPSDWPPLNRSPLKALRKILPGSPPKVLPRVLIKASLMVKVLLHLPYSHLPPTPHLLPVHKIFLPISFNSHHFPRCQPGHIVRLAVGILFLLPPLIWSSLSHLSIPSQFVIVFPISSLFSRCSLFTPDSSFPLLRFLVSPLYTNPTPLKLLPTFLRGQPGHIVRLATLTPLCPRFLCSPLSPPSFFSIYFLPLLPPFSSASPLLRPYSLSRCLPKVARPNVAAPFVAIAQIGRLPPCRAPLAWCRL